MRRVILSVGLSVGLLLSAGPGLAQPKASPPSAAAPGKPSARSLELARRYIKAMKMEESMLIVFGQMNPFAGLDPAIASQMDQRAMREAMTESITEVLPLWTEGLIPHVAAVFTEAELLALVEFYESPVGQSVIVKGQALAKPSMDVMTDLMPDFATDMLARYCQKTQCDDALKARSKRQAS